MLGADLSVVRVHTGPAAQHVAAHVHARAFTIGSHIYLNAGERPDDLALLAHEAAHTLQQSAIRNAAFPRGPPLSGASGLHLSAAPRGMVQRAPSDGSSNSPGVLDYLSSAAGAVTNVVADGFWYAVDKLAPRQIADLLHQIKDEGFWGVLKKKVSGALDFVFSALKNQGGTCAKIATLFETLIAKAKPILAALQAGDCKPLFKAVKDLGDILGKMAGDAWDKITDFLKPVGDWLSDVWQKFGAPVVDFLKQYALDTWNWIKDLGQTLWDLTKPMRDFYSGAWTEIKKLLGFGEGSDSDGSGGLVGWIKDKASAVWDEIKTELKPIIDPIKKAASAIADFLPIDAILHLREKIDAWLDKATAMADNMDQPDDVAANQDLLRDIILPGIKRAIGHLRDKVTSASNWVTEAIGGVVGKVNGFLTDLASNTWLSPFKGVISWLGDEATAIGTWASEKVAGLFGHVDNALVALESWIDPVFKLLEKLFAALSDLMGHIGDVILGPLMLVPKCIRDPIKDFIVTRILSQIPIFSQLVQLPDIWAKIQPAFRTIIVQVFRDGNLFGAAWTFFKTILSLLDVPPQLVTNLIRNAAKAIKDILHDPIGFLGNLLTALKLGLLQFIDNIGKHLLDGAIDWLLSGVKGPGIKIPDPFEISLRNVLDLVLQVLDLTKEKVFQRIEKKKGKEVADKVRKIVAAGEKIFEWVSILFTEGPAGLWKHLKADLSNLWDTMLNMVVDYLIGKIVQQATIWVTKTCASGGLSVILDAIKAVYDALQVIAQYLKQMLEVANSVCEGIIDIAKGVLNKAADMVESAAARLIPMVLAFLARTLGIGDLPKVIGEGIEKVRKTVEDAIDKLIDKTFGAIDWLKQKGKEAVDAIINWWTASEEIKTDDGSKHHVYLEGDAATAHLMVASSPMNGDAAIAAIESVDSLSAAEKATYKASAAAEKTAIDASVKKLETLNKKETAGNLPSEKSGRTEELKKETGVMREHLRALASILEESLFGGVSWKDIQDTVIPPQSGRADMVTADPLTNKGPEGSEPEAGQEPTGWLQIQEAGFTTGGYQYKQMHLINHRFGGKGVRWNLTPGSRQNNSNHLGSVENPLKELVGSNRGDKTKRGVVWYTAKVTYHPPGLDAKWPTTFVGKSGKTVPLKGTVKSDDYAQSMQLNWGVYKRKGKTWQKQPAAIGSFSVAPMPLPPFDQKIPI